MRILTMITVLSFCGTIFAQNSAKESAIGNTQIVLNVSDSISYVSVNAGKIANPSWGAQTVSLSALPRELAYSVPNVDFADSLNGDSINAGILASGQNVDVARAYAAYPASIAQQMVGVFSVRTTAHQLAKGEENSRS
ncbi:MAG: hypothetical protein ACRCY4_10290 [Brevinema sp.]